MSANRIGERFVVTSFGESHGAALGAVIEGCPAGVRWNQTLLLDELTRRRPGQSPEVSARAEQDHPEILSGVLEGVTLGTPIAILVRNQDARSKDYATIATNPRVGHADDVWKAKFGVSDSRGGGRSSGRETVARVMAGAVAQMALAHLAPDIKVRGFAAQIGPLSLTSNELEEHIKTGEKADEFVARFPSASQAESLRELLAQAKADGKSYGGIAQICVTGVPKGLGQPVFRKLKADLASALFGVGATAGLEFGAGFESSKAEGSKFHTQITSEVYGGVRGGISTGEPIVLRVAFKPTSSILDIAKQGRHDPCIVPRAIPVLEAMVHLVLVDHVLWCRTDHI